MDIPAPPGGCPHNAPRSDRCSRTTGTARSGWARTTTSRRKTSPVAAASRNGPYRRASTGTTVFSAVRPTTGIPTSSRTTASSSSRPARSRATISRKILPIKLFECYAISGTPILPNPGTCGSARVPTMRRTTAPPNMPTSTGASSTTATRRTANGYWPA